MNFRRSMRFLCYRFTACAAVLLAMPSGFAQLTNAPAALALSSSTSGPAAVMRVFGALALVLAVFFGGLWIVRNWQRFRVSQGRAPKLAVFETRSLGPRHTLYVVGYEQERMLIAASPAGVAMLTNLPRAEEEPEPQLAPATKSAPANFGVLLQALAGKL
jgi:flagellar biogenesis protein FliO